MSENANMGEVIVYQTGDGLTRVDVRFEGDSVWLTQAQLIELYHSSKANISEHIKHILEEGELDKEAVVRKFRTTAADGKSYQVMYYNLDSRFVKGCLRKKFPRYVQRGKSSCKLKFFI